MRREERLTRYQSFYALRLQVSLKAFEELGSFTSLHTFREVSKIFSRIQLSLRYFIAKHWKESFASSQPIPSVTFDKKSSFITLSHHNSFCIIQNNDGQTVSLSVKCHFIESFNFFFFCSHNHFQRMLGVFNFFTTTIFH